MTKIDHENRNNLQKAKILTDQAVSICAAPEMKTFCGKPKISTFFKQKLLKNKTDSRTPCSVCGVKISSKNPQRHHKLVHNPANCPICKKGFLGSKSLGRHIKSSHGHKEYRQYKISGL